jgi:uncharacterized protein (DUF885 family)
LSQHQIWLEKRLVSGAAGDFRLGAALYDQKLAFALFSPLSRQEIRARAETELADTRAAMYAISREVLRGRRAAPPLPENPNEAQRQQAIRAALELAYADRPARDGVLDAARAALLDTTKFVREKDLVSLPDEPLEIIAMPAFKQGVALAYCDSPGPLEAGQKTFYAVSPIPAAWTHAQSESFLREYNSRSIRNLTIHEAMPGHYLQLAHANHYPSVLRAVLSSGPFIEGWAVYGEQTMLDQGYGDGDLRLRLMQLKFYLRAVVNAILDHQMHCAKMTDDEAMKLLVEGAFQSEGEARLKLVRAKQSSTQLSTYFVGRMAHYRLRQKLERELGDKFVLGRFHEAVLEQGSIPVKYLPELVHARLMTPKD